MTRVTVEPPKKVPSARLGSNAPNTSRTDFEAHQDRVEPMLTALHRRLRLARRSRDPQGFDRDALLNLDRDAWGSSDD
jgi:hypothetical protein